MNEQQGKKQIYSFFGPPGSGKGTLAQRLVHEDGFIMLSTGNLCRQHVATGTEFGKMLNEYLKQGHLIPDALVTEMVVDWLEHLPAQQNTPIILDGFPRTQGQAELFINHLAKLSSSYEFTVVSFDVSDDEIVERLSRRVVCSKKECQGTFRESQGYKVCPQCSSTLVKRDDDREEIVRERLAQFPQYRDALLNFYKSSNQSVLYLDTSGLSAEELFFVFKKNIGRGLGS